MNGQAIIANHLAGTGPTMAARMRNLCAFTSKDMGAAEVDAVLFAVVFGWDPDADDLADGEESAYPTLAERFGWSDEDVSALRQMHALFDQLPRSLDEH